MTSRTSRYIHRLDWAHIWYHRYLERVSGTVAAALAETGAGGVDLVCHSAGGWLGRAFLGGAWCAYSALVQCLSKHACYIHSLLSMHAYKPVRSCVLFLCVYMS